MKNNWFIALGLQLFLVSPALAGDEIGNGGDHIRMVFQEARFSALEQLKLYQTPEKGDRVDLWVAKNRDKLVDEGLASSFRWSEELPEFCPKSRCACTTKEKFADIYFSLKDCQQRFIDKKDAGKIIVHELVHHFGISDEGFADAVALRIFEGFEPKNVAALGTEVNAVAKADEPMQLDYLIGGGRGLFLSGDRSISSNMLEGALRFTSLEIALQYLLWKEEQPEKFFGPDHRIYQVQTQVATIYARKNLKWFQFGFGLGRSFAEVETECTDICDADSYGAVQEVNVNHGIVEVAYKYDVTPFFRMGVYGTQFLYAKNDLLLENVTYEFPESMLSFRLSAGF